MMYYKKFVASIKCNGKVLREDNSSVYLPFGSEYSILLKNLHTRKALVHVDIDGERVTNNGLIIDANESVELERFISKNNKFKFIEKTEKISNHRGDKVDDGLVRIEFQFEQEKPEIKRSITYSSHCDYNCICCPRRYFCTYNHNKWVSSSPAWTFDNPTAVYGTSQSTFVSSSNSSLRSVSLQSNDGITVPGSKSDQTFKYGDIGILENNSDVIILHLKGERENTIINKPLTVKQKLICDICGTKNISSAKYCIDCGTALF